MDAASQHGGRARQPVLESWAARAGVAVIVGLSIYMGVQYWWPRDHALGVLTVGAELIAFAGLAVGVAQFPRAWGRGLGALAVTFLAAAWCAATMFQKIEADSRAEAVALAQELPAYVFAQSAATAANEILHQRLASPAPRPTCNCPQTVAAWEAAEAAQIERLRNERDSAVAQMQAAIPPAQIDWFAVWRGIGVEIAKLFGFTVFWLAASAPAVVSPRQPFEVVEGGLATERQPDNQPKRRHLLQLLAGLSGFGFVSTQQMVPTSPVTTLAEPPAYRPVVAISGRALSTAANQMAAQGMGERQIANQLSQQTGQRVTRHRVRVWLGREDRIAA